MTKCVFKIKYRDEESIYLRGMGNGGLLISTTVFCSGLCSISNPDYVMAGVYCRRLKLKGFM
jgi:hypothetical protein